MDPTIIGYENHQRVLPEFVVIEVVHQIAARFIKPIAHRIVTSQRLRSPRFSILIKKSLRWVVGSVGQKRRIPDEERLVTC